MRRSDLLATMFTVPLALLAAKSISASELADFDSLRSGTLRNVGGGLVNALDYGLRPGDGHGDHNAVALQRAVDDVGLGGGMIMIPTGRYEIASPISLAVNTGKRCTKGIAIVGGECAVLVSRGDTVFAITDSDDAQVARVEIRDLHLQSNFGKKMQDCGSGAA
jgi:hypothetical protein